MNACNCGASPRTTSGRENDAGIADLRLGSRQNRQKGESVHRQQDFLSRFVNFVGWIVPSAILALIPKCPVCVAGYAVIGTSVGVSLSALAQLRLALIVLCVVSLSVVGTKAVLFVITRIAAKRHS
ncbi:MAG: hypothetical protein JO025_14350 [Verrucomicrobia bacterium]|nr:hypothetical protein [Verrucomicrobiota bacterium]